MSTHTHPVVRAYLARVRTALADLPGAEIDEIVDDVRPHLAEIAERLGERADVAGMIAELGTPESYAAEVRSTGEYPPPPAAEEPARSGTPRLALARVALWGLLASVACAAVAGAVLASGEFDDDKALVLVLLVGAMVAVSGGYLVLRGTATVRELPELRGLLDAGREGNGVPRVARCLRALNPVWWVLSALVLGLLAVVAVVGHGGGVLGLVTMLALAGLALWAGPRSARDYRMVAVTLPLSAFVVGVGAGLADYVIGTARSSAAPYSAPPVEYLNYTNGGEPLLFYGSEEIGNIYVFDAKGNPLTDVYLYTEQGSPIRVPRYGCEEFTGGTMRTGTDNQFPRPRIDQGGVDDHGIVNGYNAYKPFCEEIDGVPFTVAVPNGK
ncbi:HAAS signaling domain-containing protein [Saccharomonospora xinjiangensis]|uniref:Uncharacterized protein n=1 Tax=Saccharomonospora xinjiangensis XJ-54 TaxID=882086 RepID=I0UZI4_9PSEU|nr:hypothetical protein [Saccharomonospora xinjiangensis]EID53287.1 hypothetical protein SacxiDRAFT_1026 [Saccharomonospora xinjiangensis XJ-54]